MHRLIALISACVHGEHPRRSLYGTPLTPLTPYLTHDVVDALHAIHALQTDAGPRPPQP